MNVRINDKIFPAEVLTTPEETQRGMMGRDHLDGCMVFKMGKGHHSFWMKDCLINLDIIFTLNGRITHIYLNCEAPTIETKIFKSYTGIGDHVIEFPSGTANDWKIGDRITITQ